MQHELASVGSDCRFCLRELLVALFLPSTSSGGRGGGRGWAAQFVWYQDKKNVKKEFYRKICTPEFR